jgi:iron complex transport system substrate-binding protein
VVDAEALERLSPSLILTQAVCEVCAVPTPGVRATVRERGLTAEVVSLDAHTLDDILGAIRQVATAAGEAANGERLAAELEARVVAVRDAVSDAAPPRVLAIEWLDPPFLPGHWVPEMIETAGGECVAGEAGAPSVEIGWDALRELDPDVLLVMPCGYGLEESLRDAEEHVAELMAVAQRAIDDGRAFVVDGSSYFNRSGPRAIEGVEILAGLLHPDRWPRPSERAAIRWRPGPGP